MSIFKCKMCGGDLEVTADSKIVECEYCGTSQTVPSADNEKKTNLFNRANRLRMASEFSKAAGVYESIVAEFPEEPEAYWGLCLCKYGIEYVDDPATAKKVPTCHRTSYESIFEDNNFELALEYADTVAIRLYREEAKEIDRLQKSILEIAAKEEPFDIFICYKETAEDGQRTKDSVLAQDMYDALTAKGYKVFFARITLEDKLGLEYEPYIFSALNSAKVMLAVGTKYEYYNAVWVKNEWSRFLDLMKMDKEKMLIPCYCDIDAYDMPSEFKNLQGQDMSKIGFMQDLVRGIGKVVSPHVNASSVPNSLEYSVVGMPNVSSLIERAFMCIDENDWEKADDILENILNSSPKNSVAYIGKLMVELKFNGKNIEVLPADIEIIKHKYLRMAKNYLSYSSEYENIFNSHINNLYYSIGLRYAQEGEKSDKEDFLDCYLNAIKMCELTINHPLSQNKIDEYKSIIYEKADKYSESRQIEDVRLAVSYFERIITYRDSKLRIKRHSDEIEQYNENIAKLEKESYYKKAIESLDKKDYYLAEDAFKKIKGYKDSGDLYQKSKVLADEVRQKNKIINKKKRTKFMIIRFLSWFMLLISIMFNYNKLFQVELAGIQVILCAITLGLSMSFNLIIVGSEHKKYASLSDTICSVLICVFLLIMLILTFINYGFVSGVIFFAVSIVSAFLFLWLLLDALKI